MRPNFRPFGEEPPGCPVFMCLDGWAWHPNKTKRHCHRGNVECSAKTLAMVYQGEAIERMLALRELLLTGRSQNAVLSRVFPECPLCAPDHRRLWMLRGTWRRAAMSIHEEAIPILREARPGLDMLKNPSILKRRVKESVRGLAERGIPVRDPRWDRRHPPQGETTRVAQVFWANALIADDFEEAS